MFRLMHGPSPHVKISLRDSKSKKSEKFSGVYHVRKNMLRKHRGP